MALTLDRVSGSTSHMALVTGILPMEALWRLFAFALGYATMKEEGERAAAMVAEQQQQQESDNDNNNARRKRSSGPRSRREVSGGGKDSLQTPFENLRNGK